MAPPTRQPEDKSMTVALGPYETLDLDAPSPGVLIVRLNRP
jgi:hypothetical protein